MTAAEARQAAEQLVRMAADWKGSPLGNGLFKLLSANTAVEPCVWNLIRRALPPEEYEALDAAYSAYMRPQDRELNGWLRKKEGEKRWREKKRALLLEEQRLLRKKG